MPPHFRSRVWNVIGFFASLLLAASSLRRDSDDARAGAAVLRSHGPLPRRRHRARGRAALDRVLLEGLVHDIVEWR